MAALRSAARRAAVGRPGLSRPGRPSRAAPGPGRLPGPGARRRRPARPTSPSPPGPPTRSAGCAGNCAAAAAGPWRWRTPAGTGSGRSSTASGLAVVPVPVDDQGLRADRLDARADRRRRPGGAVIISPAHQFPTGTVLSAPRRAALLAWARITRRADHRGRLRRRVPLRPPPGRHPPGRGPAVRGAGRLGEQDAVPGTGHRLDGHPARLDPGAGPPATARRFRPGRRCSTSWPFASFVRPAATTATCAPAASPTGTAATPWRRRWPPGCPRHGSPGPPRGCTCWCTCRPGTDAAAVAAAAPRGGRAGGQPRHLPDRAGPAGAGARLRQPGGHQVEAAVTRLATAVRSAS